MEAGLFSSNGRGYVDEVASSQELLAAGRSSIEAAGRDVELGLHESACLSAHRGAVLVMEALLRSRGQSIVSNSVHENVCLIPAAEDQLRAAARRLDRHRVEEGYPHRSFHASTDSAAESEGAVGDALRVLDFVERELES
jgi:HEPN domain-containing protein